MRIIKSTYAIVLFCIEKILGIGMAKKVDAWIRFGRNLNLKNPTSLADKVAYIELYEHSELSSQCTDKYEVREYLKGKGLEGILIPLVGGPWNSYLDIDFDSLPNNFVIKATHGCKMNFFVENKATMNYEMAKKTLGQWLSRDYGIYSVEPHYRSIAHRLYAEKYMGIGEKIVDYKIHCLNGKPQFILACSDRKCRDNHAMEVSLDLYDINWNPIGGLVGFGREKPGGYRLPKPYKLDEMIDIATRLSEDFKFVRVDLYEYHNKIYFSELTFSPAGCVFPYFSVDFLNDMGGHLCI